MVFKLESVSLDYCRVSRKTEATGETSAEHEVFDLNALEVKELSAVTKAKVNERNPIRQSTSQYSGERRDFEDVGVNGVAQ